MPNVAIITITFREQESEIKALDRILHRLAGDLQKRFPQARQHNLFFGEKNQIVPQQITAKAEIIYIVGHGNTNSTSVGGLPPDEIAYSLLAGCIKTLKVDWIVREIHLVACYGGAIPLTGGKIFAKELRDRIVNYLSKHVKLPLKVIGYKGFVQDITPEGEAIVIPNDKITDYENAMSEVPPEYSIEEEIKSGLSLAQKFDLDQIISNYEEYAPYKDILLQLLKLQKQTGGTALVKDALKKFAREKWRRSREEIQARFKLPPGKEKQTFAYDPITLTF
jgi:hypothetical protein